MKLPSFVKAPAGRPILGTLFLAAAAALAGPTIETNSLGLLPRKFSVEAISRDCRHVAILATGEGHYDQARYVAPKEFIRVDNQPGPEFPKILAGSAAFSPDGKRMAYAAGDGTNWFVAVNHQPGPAFDEILASPVAFSPDGRHVAYGARKGPKCFVMLDDHAGPEFDSIRSASLTFSPDSQRLAYIATNGAGVVAVVDGRPGPTYDLASELTFSADSKRFGYIGHTTQGRTCAAAVVDGKPDPEYDNVHTLAFSPDGKHLAYSAWKGDACFVVLDGRKGPATDGVILGTPLFSPDGRRLAYATCSKSGKSVVMVGGTRGPEFPYVFPPVFSPDSKRMAYRAWLDPHREQIVLDGKPGEQMERFFTIAFSSDGKRFAYGGKNGDSVLVIDGERQKYPLYFPDSLVFSPDGKHVAYISRPPTEMSRQCVIVDGKPGPSFYEIDTFVEGQWINHKDGTHSFIPRRDKAYARSLTFDVDGTVEYLAQADTVAGWELFRVRQRP